MTSELLVFFASMVPFLEIKLAIPLGLSLGLSKTSTFLFAVTGSLIPPAIMLAIIGPTVTFATKHSKRLKVFFEKLFAKTRKDHTKKFNRYGAIFIIALIAAPLPGSGNGTAVIISYLFGLDYWKAFGIICVGSVASSLLLLGGFESVFAILDLFT